MKRTPMTDRELEQYLLSFRPLAPASPIVVSRSIVPLWRVAAVLAVLLIAGILLVRVSLPGSADGGVPYQAKAGVPIHLEVTALRLNQAAAQGDAALESALLRQVRTLPSVNRANSALSVLARDYEY